MKRILITFVLITFIFRLWQTTGCQSFLSYWFNPLSIKISVEEQVNSDNNSNRQVSRFFHNKASSGAIEISKSYLNNIEPRHLLEILGPLGILLFLVSIAALVKKPKRLQVVHLIFLLSTMLFSIMSHNAKLVFFINAITLYSFSLWAFSIIEFNKKRSVIF